MESGVEGAGNIMCVTHARIRISLLPFKQIRVTVDRTRGEITFRVSRYSRDTTYTI